MARRLESVTRNRKSDLSVDANLIEEQSCQISSRSDLIRRSFGVWTLLVQLRLDKNKKNKNMMSSNVGSVPDPRKKKEATVIS